MRLGDQATPRFRWADDSAPVRTGYRWVEEEEDERSLFEKLLASLGGGLLEGAAGVPEAIGKIGAAPSRLLGLEKSGEDLGPDWAFDAAEWLREQKPEEPEGLGYKILGGLAQAPGTLLKYAPAAIPGVGILGDAGIIGAETGLEAYGGGEDPKEALMKAAISAAAGGTLGKLASAPLAGRLVGGAVTGGLASAIEGGDAEDIAANALAMGLLTGAMRAPRRVDGRDEILSRLKLLADDRTAYPDPAGPGAPIGRGEPGGAAVPEPAPAAPRSLRTEEIPAAPVTGTTYYPSAEASDVPMIPRYPVTGKPPKTLLNYDRMNSPEEYKAATEGMLNISARLLDEMTEAVPLSETSARVPEFLRKHGTDPSKWAPVDLSKGRDALAVQNTAKRFIRETMYHDLDTVGGQIAQAEASGADAAVIGALREKEREIAMTAMTMTTNTVGSQREIARALSAMRIYSRTLTPAERAAVELTKRGRFSREIGEALSEIPPENFEKAHEIFRTALKPKWSDRAYELWIQGLLSSPMTHGVNSVSNIVTQGVSMAERPVAAGLEALRKGGDREVFFSEIGADFAGLIRSIPSGLRAARMALEGKAPLRSKFEHPRALPETVGGIPLPTTALSASDEFFKAIASGRELHTQAYRKARLSGKGRVEAFGEMDRMLSGIVKDKNILDSMRRAAEQDKNMAMLGGERDPIGDIVGKALKAGEVQTFTNELGPGGKAVLSLKEQLTGVRWLIPFVQAPVNIAKYGWKRTPFGLAKSGYDLMRGKAVSSEDLAANVMGSLISLGIAWQAKEGNVTGSGPSDPGRRQQCRAAGNLPYSVKAGDRWVSYQRLEPLSTVFGVAADMAEATSPDEQQRLLRKVQNAVAQNLTNKTFLQGVENFFQVVSDPERYGESALKSWVGSAIPAVAGATARAIDPTLREVHVDKPSDLLDVLAARIPGLSETLPPRYDTTGRPAQRAQAGFGEDVDSLIRAVSPVQISKPRPESELPAALSEAGIGKRPPGRKDEFRTLTGDYERYTMTPEEQKEMAAADAVAEMQLLPLVRSELWPLLDNKQKKKIVDDVYDRLRRTVRAQIENRRAMAA